MKSDLVLLFELASGISIEDYLWDRANRAWSWRQISEEMNGLITKMLVKEARGKGLFEVNDSNMQRWYGMFGIKSKLKKRIKKRGKR